MRCSLLGHDFGDPEVEREREERGSEVVVVVTEFEECDRCGERHVLSENTEVTSLDAGAGADDEADADAAEGFDDGSGVPTDEQGDPITDDAEILDDGPTASERGHGEWPDSDDVGPPVGARDEPAAWPDADDGASDVDVGEAFSFEEDDPVDAAEDDAVFVDADPDPAEVQTEAETGEADTGIASPGAAPAPGESAPRESVPTEFFCPRCEFVAPGDRGSLRPGDICPECRKGYLGERER